MILGNKHPVRQQRLAMRHEVAPNIQPQVVHLSIRPQRHAHREPGIGVGFGG